MNLKGRKGSEAVRSTSSLQSSKNVNNSVPGEKNNNAHKPLDASSSHSDFFRKDVLRSLTPESAATFFANSSPLHFMGSSFPPPFATDALDPLHVQAILSAARSSFNPFLSTDLTHGLFRASGLLPQANGVDSPDDLLMNESMKRILEVKQKEENGHSNGSSLELRKLPFAGLDSLVKSEAMSLDQNSLFQKVRTPVRQGESKRPVIDVPASVRDSILRSNTPLRMESDGEDSFQRDSSADDEGHVVGGSSDGKKARVRSVLSEETLQILRNQYNINPRPKKNDILRLAQQVNYSTRVVQVWFQNMRARDRRLGRPVPNSDSSEKTHPSTRNDTQSPPSSHHLSNSLYPHSDSSPLASQVKVVDGTNCNNFPSPVPSSPKRLSFSPHLSLSPAAQDHKPNGERRDAAGEQPLDLSCRPCSKSSNKSSSFLATGDVATKTAINLSYQAIDQASRTPINQFLFGLKSEGQRMADEREMLDKMDVHVDHVEKWNHSSSSLSNEFAAMNGCSRKRRSDSSSDGENNSEDGSQLSKGVLNDCNSMNGEKMVRMSDSSGMESGSFDGQADANGLFNCDQCDKTFSKQSSLARHKYEHSGQSYTHCHAHTNDPCVHRSTSTQVRRMHEGIQAQTPPDRTQAPAFRGKALPMQEVSQALLSLRILQVSSRPSRAPMS